MLERINKEKQKKEESYVETSFFSSGRGTRTLDLRIMNPTL